jgi:hypothetical protein
VSSHGTARKSSAVTCRSVNINFGDSGVCSSNSHSPCQRIAFRVCLVYTEHSLKVKATN